MTLQIVEARQADFIDEWMKEYYDSPVNLRTKRLGFGRNPAVLLIDLQGSIRLGGLVARAVANNAVLLKKAREKGVPLFYTVIGYRSDLKDFIPNKLGAMTKHIVGTESVKVMDEVKPRDEDVVLIKKGNSAFFGTDLLVHLNRLSIDTLIITGIHTSGCIRATASDSFSLGYKTIIPEECVGDNKGVKPHKANLCDLHIRGGDVIILEEVLNYLDGLGKGDLRVSNVSP